jgi:hypothetical protein
MFMDWASTLLGGFTETNLLFVSADPRHHQFPRAGAFRELRQRPVVLRTVCQIHQKFEIVFEFTVTN